MHTLRKPTPAYAGAGCDNAESALIWNRHHLQSTSISPALIRLMLVL